MDDLTEIDAVIEAEQKAAGDGRLGKRTRAAIREHIDRLEAIRDQIIEERTAP